MSKGRRGPVPDEATDSTAARGCTGVHTAAPGCKRLHTAAHVLRRYSSWHRFPLERGPPPARLPARPPTAVPQKRERNANAAICCGTQGREGGRRCGRNGPPRARFRAPGGTVASGGRRRREEPFLAGSTRPGRTSGRGNAIRRRSRASCNGVTTFSFLNRGARLPESILFVQDLLSAAPRSLYPTYPSIRQPHCRLLSESPG
jgi:hypothetical protein